jgi:hypothetical protein
MLNMLNKKIVILQRTEILLTEARWYNLSTQLFSCKVHVIASSIIAPFSTFNIRKYNSTSQQESNPYWHQTNCTLYYLGLFWPMLEYMTTKPVNLMQYFKFC